MRKFLLVAFVSLAALSAPAYADFYVGASYLSTDADFSTAVDDFSLDDSGYKIFAGWDFFKFVGLELSYRDLGNFEDSGFGADVTAYDAAVRGIIPLKFLELFGKIGYADIKTDGEDSGVSFDDSSWELFYGVGIGINFGKHFGIRAEWEEYDTDESMNSFSAGALFKF